MPAPAMTSRSRRRVWSFAGFSQIWRRRSSVSARGTMRWWNQMRESSGSVLPPSPGCGSVPSAMILPQIHNPRSRPTSDSPPIGCNLAIRLTA